jgi:hypothetical protein
MRMQAQLRLHPHFFIWKQGWHPWLRFQAEIKRNE